MRLNLTPLPSVLELGAGAALPSMIAALCGASVVVATDYPDLPLIAQMKDNIAAACPPHLPIHAEVPSYIAVIHNIFKSSRAIYGDRISAD